MTTLLHDTPIPDVIERRTLLSAQTIDNVREINATEDRPLWAVIVVPPDTDCIFWQKYNGLSSAFDCDKFHTQQEASTAMAQLPKTLFRYAALVQFPAWQGEPLTKGRS